MKEGTPVLCSMCEDSEANPEIRRWPAPVCDGCDKWLTQLGGDLQQLEAEDPAVAEAARKLDESVRAFVSQIQEGPNKIVNAEIHCSLCPTKIEAPLVVPKEWEYIFLYEEHALCPDHRAIAEFRKSQCPGCVGGWGDCDMWRAFAFDGRRSMTDDDYATLESGICPRRTGGTFGFRRGDTDFHDIDLSERAPTGGPEFATAIREYIERYPDDARP